MQVTKNKTVGISINMADETYTRELSFSFGIREYSSRNSESHIVGKNFNVEGIKRDYTFVYFLF